MPASTVYYPRCFAAISAILDGRGAEDQRIIDRVAPQSATMHLNGFNEADTWELVFDARALPFDPDLLKSVAVEIYLYGAPSLQDNRTSWATPENRVIAGLNDEGEIDLSATGRWVRMSGRDYTGILLDIDWDPRQRIQSGQRITKTVEDIIAAYVPSEGPFASRFEVAYESDDPEPVVGAAYRATTKQNGQHVRPGKKVWDVIYELALRYGFLAYVDGERIVITEPRIQTVASLSEAPRMAYGRNLGNLHISRRFGRDRVPVVLATSYDPKTRRRFEERWPRSGDGVDTAIGIRKNEVQRVIAPPGITDRGVLRRFARTRAENLGRAEATYSWRTHHLRALPANASDPIEGPSLLQLRAGDAVVVQFDPFNLEEMRTLTPAQIAEHLRAQGYTSQVAQAVASNFLRLQQFQQPYYTKTVEYQWDSSSGLVISWEGKNFAFVPREENR